MAQAEHGEDSPVYCISPESSLLDEVAEILAGLWPKRPSVTNAEVQLIDVSDAAGALEVGPRRSRPSTSSSWGRRPRRSPTGLGTPAACS